MISEKPTRRMTLFSTLILLFGCSPRVGNLDGITNHRQAVEVLEAGIESLGGFEALNPVSTLRFDLETSVYDLGQGPHPRVDRSEPVQRLFYRFTTSLLGDRVFVEAFPTASAPSPVFSSIITKDLSLFRLTGQDAVRSIDRTETTAFLSSFPTVFSDLLQAWRNAEGLRYLGRICEDTSCNQALTFVDDAGIQKTLYFDESSLLPVRSLTISSGEPYGDVMVETTYSDFEAVGGVSLPWVARKTVKGALESEIRVVEASFRHPLHDSLFLIPESAEPLADAFPATDDPRSMTVEEIADGVFLVSDAMPGYNLLFVEQENRIILIEAIGGLTLSQTVLDAIKSTIPGKPVTHVVLTHHHHDHSNGLWAYMKEGAAIVTTPGLVEFVQDVAASPRRTRQGLETLDQPRIDLVDGKRVYESTKNRMVLYDVGPNPHSDEILIAYLPEHRMIFLSDVYGHRDGTDEPSVLLAFARVLKQMQLDIEKVVTAHTRPVTMAELEATIAMAREEVAAGSAQRGPGRRP